MLTVLHRHKDGSEKIFMAESVWRTSRDGEECVPAQGGFIAHGVQDGGAPSDYLQFDIEAPFGAVFVMNNEGQTVARYFAAPPQAKAA